MGKMCGGGRRGKASGKEKLFPLVSRNVREIWQGASVLVKKGKRGGSRVGFAGGGTRRRGKKPLMMSRWRGRRRGTKRGERRVLRKKRVFCSREERASAEEKGQTKREGR